MFQHFLKLKSELHDLISSLSPFHHFTPQTEAHLYLTFALTFLNSKKKKKRNKTFKL